MQTEFTKKGILVIYNYYNYAHVLIISSIYFLNIQLVMEVEIYRRHCNSSTLSKYRIC